ncbi:mitochondrial import inner membrane translocase subunit Tim9-like [Panicum virgatum]|uniref:Mitochondrial import inner membrane translocase subunit n=1 Tax=Panicum virgatum TaxID=38727 RepID=A0A8T0VBG9_PANVG|nr:mitochondrial import inner membrane translocase subunit Tim9-like [Panicum virgatum]KAG2630153.1 hypothetical protein PVAP13_3KG498900 [Panicum virgatum]
MDKDVLGGVDGLAEVTAIVELLDIRDSLRIYNSLVERCLSDCVDTSHRKTLDKQEESCVRGCVNRGCVKKFLKHSMRVGMRFAEINKVVATPD